MKIEWLKDTIGEYESAGNKIYGFYVTYRETKNITSQRWGKICEFADVLSKIESSDECVQGELPVDRLVIHSGEKYRWQCLVFAKNPLWNPADGDSQDSHTMVVAPYIAEDGWFGKIISERETAE